MWQPTVKRANCREYCSDWLNCLAHSSFCSNLLFFKPHILSIRSTLPLHTFPFPSLSTPSHTHSFALRCRARMYSGSSSSALLQSLMASSTFPSCTETQAHHITHLLHNSQTVNNLICKIFITMVTMTTIATQRL